MASKNIEFRVGLLIIAAVIIVVGAIVWIQGYRFGKGNYSVTVVFSEVGSLNKGDPVMVSGIRMGKVTDLRLIEGGVEVELVLGNEVILKRDAEIVVKNIGLMGERFVAVYPGKEEERLDLSKPVIGGYDTGIPEVMGMMGEMTTELRNLVQALKTSVASDENLEKLTETIANFQDVSESLSEYLKDNRNRFDDAAKNFVKSSSALKKLIESSSERVDSVMVRTDSMTIRMKAIADDLEYMAQTAREFADKLNQGEGTLQLLVEDRRLYDDLRKTADNIDDLVRDIRDNPRKYLRLTVELF